ncbi:bifunctional precorrin-2 dehydrogenase/sirohydrochlorin ferrochelatase [Methanococcus maripaludis]|uniref:precorrin-2 dehydrogenase n=2 Tax=Methanococcus maripaludis TaxID=39152 RepID=A0A7J9PIK5_METMI|nr:bifunctional precorrin-2 dehydrogenase/sirohydrochlorin ferrochelatase [Methanococcus maripaludis]MBA2862578.1 precorrin-2 dehydrogenase/sirohydrochlorin ferrochelatase [Methanococcus maripaludis]
MIPVFLELKGFNVLIFGFGNVGKRRFEKFLDSCAKITVYSKSIAKKDISKYENARFFECDVSNLSDEELYSIIKNHDIIITAIDEKNNKRIVSIAKSINKFINSSTFEKESNLIVPAYCSVDGVSFAVYTGGKSPIVAREIRKNVEEYLKNSEFEISFQNKLRDFLKNEIEDQNERKKVLENVFSDEKFKKELLELIEKHR